MTRMSGLMSWRKGSPTIFSGSSPGGFLPTLRQAASLPKAGDGPG